MRREARHARSGPRRSAHEQISPHNVTSTCREAGKTRQRACNRSFNQSSTCLVPICTRCLRHRPRRSTRSQRREARRIHHDHYRTGDEADSCPRDILKTEHNLLLTASGGNPPEETEPERPKRLQAPVQVRCAKSPTRRTEVHILIVDTYEAGSVADEGRPRSSAPRTCNPHTANDRHWPIRRRL